MLQHFLKGFPWMNPNLRLIFGVLQHFESIEQVIGTDMVGFLKVMKQKENRRKKKSNEKKKEEKKTVSSFALLPN